MENKPADDLNPIRLFLILILAATMFMLTACSPVLDQLISEEKNQPIPGLPTAIDLEVLITAPAPDNTEQVTIVNESLAADVVSVAISGSPNAYQFSTTISSPDTGCLQYADWWEVITEDGRLLYRRILLHSHVTEQPFTRSGGPIEIDPDTIVIIRAHLNPAGYGGQALRGSPQAGFELHKLEPGFAADLEISSPLPAGCDF